MSNKYLTQVMVSAALALSLTCAPRLSEEQLVEKARGIHDRAITIDTHVDISGNYATEQVDPGIDNPRLRCDLVKMENGGLDGVFLAVFVGQRGQLDDEGYRAAQQAALNKFEAIHRLAEEMYPDRCELATTPDDVERIEKTGKRVIMIGIENGFPVGEDLSTLKKYHELGARYITLCHSGHNQICDSSSPREPLHHGISEFGEKVVAEMNRLGIMCDVSHISEESFWDLVRISQAPIIASHSGCTAVAASDRNLTDEQLKALAKNGGVIQIVALASYLKEADPARAQELEQLRVELGMPDRRAMRSLSDAEREALLPKMEEYSRRSEEIAQKYPGADIKDFVDHVDHAVRVAGINHVGIGTDFDGGGGIPGFQNHADALNVTIELVRRGYSEKEIKKIWGGNLLRVWRDVEKVAQQLQNSSSANSCTPRQPWLSRATLI